MMMSFKTVSVESSDGVIFRPVVCESFTNGAGSMFTWPCAYLLCAFISSRRKEFAGKVVLELGAGTAMPSVVAALAGASKVIVTDRANQPTMGKLMHETIRRNNISSVCTVEPLDWSDPPKTLPYVDVVIGADIFYSTSDFEPLMCLVAQLFLLNPHLVVYTTYQQRSSHRSLAPLLESYGINAITISKRSFLHRAHCEGFCLLQQYVPSEEDEATTGTGAVMAIGATMQRASTTPTPTSTISSNSTTINNLDTFKHHELADFDSIELFRFSLV